MRIRWWNRPRRAARPGVTRPGPTTRLRVESLEPREVPTTSPFFLDTRGQLWGATDTTGKVSRFTGLTGAQFSVGEVAPTGGGGQFAVVRDAQKHIAIFNGNNDVVTPTDLVARDVVAGRGEVFFRDAQNQLVVLTLGALNPDGTFAFTTVPTAQKAVQMDLGFDNVNSRDFLAFRAPDRSVHVLEMIGGTPVIADTGAAKAIDLEAGNQWEVFLRRPNNLVDVVTITSASVMGFGFAPIIETGKKALSLSVGRGSPIGSDAMAYRAPGGSVHYMRYFPGVMPSVLHVDLDGVFARQVVMGSNEIFIRDRTNQVRVFSNVPAGTSFTEVTVPPLTATRIVVTSFVTVVAPPIDQIVVLTSKRQMLVSQNNPGGTEIASFYNTGFLARSVEGFAEFP